MPMSADDKKALRIRKKLEAGAKPLTESEEEFIKEYDKKHNTKSETAKAKNRVGRELIVRLASETTFTALEKMDETATICGADYTLWTILKTEMVNNDIDPRHYITDCVSDLIPNSLRFKPKHELLALCLAQGAQTGFCVYSAQKTEDADADTTEKKTE